MTSIRQALAGHRTPAEPSEAVQTRYDPDRRIHVMTWDELLALLELEQRHADDSERVAPAVSGGRPNAPAASSAVDAVAAEA